jgi:hypothetical protein
MIYGHASELFWAVPLRKKVRNGKKNLFKVSIIAACQALSSLLVPDDVAKFATRRPPRCCLNLFNYKNHAHSHDNFRHCRCSCTGRLCRQGDPPEFSRLRYCRLSSFRVSIAETPVCSRDLFTKSFSRDKRPATNWSAGLRCLLYS